MMCGKALLLLLLGAPTCGEAAEEVVQVVLDDMDAAVNADVHNTYEGSYQPCMEDAYQGQFHHDWAKNKGNAHFGMVFDPPQTGCYMIEEHHPGSNSMCAQYSPQNARLEVDYCRGQSTNFTINQATNGAQWNKLGALMFYEGEAGKFTMRSSVNEKCSASECFLVADAFRLTWLGEACRMARGTSPEPTSRPASTSGILQLGLTMDGSSMVAVDAQVQLRSKSGAMESVLAAHFGYDRVEVVEIKFMDGRRLQSGDLPAQSYEVHFEAYGEATAAPRALEVLVEALDANLASSGLDVTSAAITWAAPKSSESPESSQVQPRKQMCTIAVVGGVSLCILSTLCFAIACFRKRRMKGETQDLPARDAEKAETGESSEEPDKVSEASKPQDVEAASNSTGEPLDQHSEPGTSEEGNKSTDAEQLDEQISSAAV